MPHRWQQGSVLLRHGSGPVSRYVLFAGAPSAALCRTLLRTCPNHHYPIRLGRGRRRGCRGAGSSRRLLHSTRSDCRWFWGRRLPESLPEIFMFGLRTHTPPSVPVTRSLDELVEILVSQPSNVLNPLPKLRSSPSKNRPRPISGRWA
jgi:hypothetical protein